MEDHVRLICGVIYFIFVFCSLIINLLLLIVLIKGHKEFKKASFFILTWQLLFLDFLSLTNHLFLAIPTTIAGYQFYSDFFNYFFSMFDKVSYNGTLLFALILTLNRFMVFLFPKFNERIFGQPEIYYTIAFAWILLAALIIAVSFGGWFNFFDPHLFRLISIKREIRPWYSQYILEPFIECYSQFAPWVMISFYVITFLEIKFHLYTRLRYGRESLPSTTATSRTTKKKGEINVLLQCFIICSVFQIEWFGFNYLPQLPTLLPFLENYVNTITCCMTVTMNTVHSIVIFTFTSRARAILKSFFKKTKSPNILSSSTVFVVAAAAHRKMSVFSPTTIQQASTMMMRRSTVT